MADPLSLGAQIGLGAASTAFQGLSGLLSSGISYRRQKDLLKRQYEYSERAATSAYNRQLEFWNMQNEYNTPSAQRSRLEEANLSPALMYGGNGATTPAQGLSNVPQADSGSTPSVETPFSVGDPINNAMRFAQIRNIEANTKKVEGDTVDPGLRSRSLELANQLASENIISQKTSNEIKSLQLQFDTATFDNRVEQSAQTLRNMRQQVESLKASMQVDLDRHANNPLVRDQILQQTRTLAVQAGLFEAQAELARHGIVLQKAQIEQIEQTIRNMEAQQGVMASEVDKNYSVSENYRLQNVALSVANEYIRAKSVSSVWSNWSGVARDMALTVYGGMRGLRMMK